jgi:CHRD domain
MTVRLVLAVVALATSLPTGIDPAAAQSSAGAPVAQGKTRAYGRPFAGYFGVVTARDTPVEKQFGTLYAVLDYKGKIGINGTFEGLTSPATAAYLHKGTDGQRGPRVMEMTVSKRAHGVVKGDITLTEAEIADLQKGLYYVEIATEKAADGEVRGWLVQGFLK